MKKIYVLLSIIFCGAILIFSYITWKEKLASAGQAIEQTSAVPLVEETQKEAELVGETVSKENTAIDLDKLTVAMDPQVQELFFNRRDQGETVQLLIIGSDAMELGDPGYGHQLSEALKTSYAGFVETEMISYNGTSEEFMFNKPQLTAGYDVVLLEPFTLKNNGRITIEAEHGHIQNIIGEVQTVESDAVLVLHPPQPIYGAQFYKTQVTALEEFAEYRNYAYIDHWSNWPSTEDLALKEYLTEESNPNNTGAVTWANAIIAYFTGS